MADYAIHDTTLEAIADTIRKKDGTQALIDPADYSDRINLMGMLEEKTASSASVCSFSDGADDVPMSSVIAHIAPTLTGTNAVNMVQSGKNLISTIEQGGIDGTNGTETASNTRVRTGFIKVTSSTKYTCAVNSSNTNMVVFQVVEYSSASTSGFISATGKNAISTTFTTSATTKYIRVTARDTTSANITPTDLSNWQLEQGETATTFEAFNGEQYTANLGRTVYGADVDIVTGEGEATHGKLVLSSENMNIISRVNANKYRVFNADFGAEVTGSDYATNILVSGGSLRPQTGSSNDDRCYINASGDFRMNFTNEYNSVADMIADVGTITLIYPLATPTDFTFDGQEIPSLLGVNNLWHDAGDTEAVYRSSGTVTPVPVVPTLITKSITENGTYSAEDDDADGYSSVTVSVSGGSSFVPTFSETLIADNSSHASSFTLSEDYGNYDMVKIVWYESASSSGFLYTTPDILDEIFTISTRVCINKPDTNTYVCYSKNGLTWTRTNNINIDVHEIYGVTFTNCSMTATDLYKRGAVTTSSASITSQTSLKDFDLIMMSSIHNTDGSETMPCTWLYTYPNDAMVTAFSGMGCPYILEEYSAYNENFRMTEYGMTSARYFMVQGIKFTPTQSLLSMSPAPVSQEESEEEEDEQNESD